MKLVVLRSAVGTSCSSSQITIIARREEIRGDPRGYRRGRRRHPDDLDKVQLAISGEEIILVSNFGAAWILLDLVKELYVRNTIIMVYEKWCF